MSSALNILLEMGFPQNKVEKALSVTGNVGVEQAMEWLLAHSDDLDDSATGVPQIITNENAVEEAQSVEEEEVNSQGDSIENEQSEQKMAKSLKCDECGKLLKSEEEVEFHAAKTGHVNFSESEEEIKPLTEEEKKQRVKMLEEKIKLRRLEKEAQEKREQIEREKRRRRTGQEIIEAKKKLEEEDLKRIAEQRRKEKMEDKMARQKILEQIERDKQARKEKFSSGNQANAAVAPTVPVAAPTATASTTSQKKEYEETKIQIRLPTGQVLTQTFGSKEELAAVRLYIQMNQTEINTPFTLMTSFPKRIFNDEDMEKPLYELGLVPSAVLILCKKTA